MKTALIAGATGLVGGELLSLLLADDTYSTIIAVTRRKLNIEDPRLMNVIVDFKDSGPALTGMNIDHVFCCLGTTISAAGSKEKFREVDFEYPLTLARVTNGLGAQQYLLVSALGADSRSRIFYNRVKGEVEEAIRAVGFPSFHIFRPSLLLGQRPEKRAGEDAAKTLYRVFGFIIPRKYKAIPASAVARAMIAEASKSIQGFHIHESGEMQQYA